MTSTKELSKELRIGNYINYIKSPFCCTISTIHAISNIEGDSIMYTPIPITEDWLIRFGFERYETEKSVNFKLGLFRFTFVCEGRSKGKNYLNYKLGMAGITFNNYCDTNSVHQLQNLYYALTGSELVRKRW